MVEHLFGIALAICPDFSLVEFQEIVPKIRKMQSAWIAGHTHGFDTSNHGGNVGYVHTYFSHVDEGSSDSSFRS